MMSAVSVYGVLPRVTDAGDTCSAPDTAVFDI